MEFQSVHSVFDCIFGSFRLLNQASKAVSKWTANLGELIAGGQLPTFDDIETDADVLKKFTNVPFEEDTDRRWNPKARELLVMALLLRHDQFCDVLESHPFATVVEADGLVDSPNNHRFVCSTV